MLEIVQKKAPFLCAGEAGEQSRAEGVRWGYLFKWQNWPKFGAWLAYQRWGCVVGCVKKKPRSVALRGLDWRCDNRVEVAVSAAGRGLRQRVRCEVEYLNA